MYIQKAVKQPLLSNSRTFPFLFWQHWGLNSWLHACKASSPPLEPHLQKIPGNFNHPKGNHISMNSSSPPAPGSHQPTFCSVDLPLDISYKWNPAMDGLCL
jgi:hypothetical protein